MQHYPKVHLSHVDQFVLGVQWPVPCLGHTWLSHSPAERHLGSLWFWIIMNTTFSYGGFLVYMF